MTTRTDDGTLRWWLALADEIETYETRAEREAHIQRVRAAIGGHINRTGYWNTRVCDALDVAKYMGTASSR